MAAETEEGTMGNHWRAFFSILCVIQRQYQHKNICWDFSLTNVLHFVFLPEFFADNLGDFFIFLRRFADEVLETAAESLEQILDFITVFLGNIER